jgi:hypothetical protein
VSNDERFRELWRAFGFGLAAGVSVEVKQQHFREALAPIETEMRRYYDALDDLAYVHTECGDHVGECGCREIARRAIEPQLSEQSELGDGHR